jgi:hypothetical protein
MKYIHQLFFLLLVSFALTSCEKVIELEVDENQSKIVITGSIIDQAGPYYVDVKKSSSLYNNSPAENINNAVVTITDDAGGIEVLTLVGNGRYQTNTTQGVSGRTYTIDVKVDNQSYRATSTMPSPVEFIQIQERRIEFGPNTNIAVIPNFVDPITFGNNYRFVTSVNGVQQSIITVDTDNVNNGRGYERPIFSPDLELMSGDTVAIEMQCIDAQAYLYYFSLAQIVGQGPGGGATPSNPPNGFTNGALGVFSAHTTQTKQIIIQ